MTSARGDTLEKVKFMSSILKFQLPKHIFLVFSTYIVQRKTIFQLTSLNMKFNLRSVGLTVYELII